MEGVVKGRMIGMAYRDKNMFAGLCQKILPVLREKNQELGRKLRFMEVCGTHTVSFSKTGVRELIADYVELVSGPGCPVCVTDQTDMDHMIAFAKRNNTIVATFGDMMKVPGSFSNLYQERAEGADVRIVYSPSQAVEIARKNPSKQVVFLGVGFETTVPSIALSIKKAELERISNYYVYSAHKLTPPALQPLIQDSEHQLDGFLLPGHVSVIIGRIGWGLLETLNEPAVIGGFEPFDLLTSIYLLTLEMNKEKRTVVNNYPRFVRENGNVKAQELLKDIFEVAAVQWRGFGILPNSGLKIHTSYKDFDALINVPVEKPMTKRIRGCRCGEIVKGKETPFDCTLFAKACTPENPIGPCMVSSEGTCSTYYQFERGKENLTY